MKPVLPYVAGVALMVSLGRLAGSVPGVADRVYTVDEVQAGLAARPTAWIGRTVVVRAEATNQGALLSCWRPTIVTGGVAGRAVCPAPGTVTESLAATTTRVMRLGTQSFQVTGPSLIVVRQDSAGAPPQPSAGLTMLLLHVTQLPVLGPLMAAVAPAPATLYRVRLLGPGQCAIPPAPCPQAIMR